MTSYRPPEDSVTAFFQHIKAERIEAVALALAAGMPASIQNANYQSALTVAAQVGFIDGAKALIAAGANINQRDYTSFADKSGKQERSHQTPLINAINAKDLDMIELLLDSGADPRIATENGNNPAHYLLFSGMLSRGTEIPVLRRSLAILKRLVEPDGVVNTKNVENRDLLHPALASWIDADPAAVEIVLSRGPDLEAMSHGERPVHRPWHESSLWMLRMLIEHGADINGRDWRGNSALCYAEDVEAVDAILELGGDLNHLNNLGRNALGAACDPSTDDLALPTEVAAHLISAGIDTSNKDFTGANVESLLAASGRDDSEKLLALIQARKARVIMYNASRSATTRPQ